MIEEQHAVAVVIPTRNRRRLLGRTLQSVLDQVDVDLQVVVVDEASEDGTSDAVRTLRDDRITVLRNETPSGPATARNQGTRVTDTPWVAWCDDDDRWAPDKLISQLRAAARPDHGWAIASTVIVDPHDRIYRIQHVQVEGDVAVPILERNIVPGGGSGVVARRSLFDEVGGFDPEFSLFADWDLWTRFGLASPVAAVHRPLVAYLRHTGAMTQGPNRFDDELAQIDEKYAGERDHLGATLDVGLLHHWSARQHTRAGRRWDAAAGHLRSASARRSPTSLVRAVAVATVPEWSRRRATSANAHGLDHRSRAELDAWLTDPRSALAD